MKASREAATGPDDTPDAPAPTARISPTAWYTGYVWVKNGLSHPALAMGGGRALFWAVEPAMRLAAPFSGGMTLEGMLLQRHRLLDHLLAEAVEAGRVKQVVELASGLSARGARFAERYPSVPYVETDLPAMVELKRGKLAAAGWSPPNHRQAVVDLLDETGPRALANLDFDRSLPTAFLTEGLVNYFDTATVLGMWRRVAAVGAELPGALYLSDMRLDRDVRGVVRLFLAALGVFARGRVHCHFPDRAAAELALRDAGFEATRVDDADDHPDLDLPRARGRQLMSIVRAASGSAVVDGAP